MTSTEDRREAVKSAAAEALDYGLNDATFDAVVHIAIAIVEDGEMDPHDIADSGVAPDTPDLVQQWLGLNAQGAAANAGIAAPTTDAEDLMRQDVYAVLSDAASAALDADPGEEDDEEE